MSDRIVTEIKRRAFTFVNDNWKHPLGCEYAMIESAMLIGAGIAISEEVAISKGDTDSPLQELFDSLSKPIGRG